jgi:hypothetical protein
MINTKRISGDISIWFKCGDYFEERIVLSKPDIPTFNEGHFFNQKYLSKGEQCEMGIKFGLKTLSSKSGELPRDWKNIIEWVEAPYVGMDKKLLRKLPYIGLVLESLAPDIRWEFDLWYQFLINEEGKLEYKLHLHPSYTIEVRMACEGYARLI